MHTQYFQILENNHPLSKHKYQTQRQARIALRAICNYQIAASEPMGYDFERRLPHLPITNVMWLQKNYEDGSNEKYTYRIIHATKITLDNKII